jgi:hypothetical protein
MKSLLPALEKTQPIDKRVLETAIQCGRKALMICPENKGKNLLSSPFLLPIVRGIRSKCTVFGVMGKLFLPLNLIETN